MAGQRIPNRIRRKVNRRLYRWQRGCWFLKAQSGAWRYHSGMQNTEVV